MSKNLQYHHPLNEAELRTHKIPTPWTFGIADRVRFGELDALGHVNNTAYLTWFESFRLPFLKARHVTDYGPTAPRLVLKQATCNYLSEMGMGEDYIVTGRVRRFRNTSFTTEYAVWRIAKVGAPECTAEGSAIVVLLNNGAPGRYAIPDLGRRAFLEEDGAEAERQ